MARWSGERWLTRRAGTSGRRMEAGSGAREGWRWAAAGQCEMGSSAALRSWHSATRAHWKVQELASLAEQRLRQIEDDRCHCRTMLANTRLGWKVKFELF